MTLTTFSLFLSGLAATALPVLLHLLLRGKPKRIEFPALMFLKKHLETQRRNDRIKQVILLALRMLALVFFGLALARPMVKLADWFPTLVMPGQNEPGQIRSFVSSLAASLTSQDVPIAAAVVIDSSPRMAYVADNQSRLEAAQDFSQWILAQLPQDSAIAVLSSERETPVFQVDRLAATEKIDRLRMTPQGKPVAETVRDALTLLAGSEHSQRELYIVTDLSEPGWPGDFGTAIKNAIEGLKSGANPFGVGEQELGVFLVDVGADAPVNTSFVRLSLMPEIMAEKSPVRIDVEAAHTGHAVTKTIELLLTGVDPEAPNKETVRSTKSVTFDEGHSRKHVSFTLSGLPLGTQQGKLRFAAPDALPTDDQAWFTAHVQKPAQILLLASPPVWDRTIYLREALDPRDSSEPTPFDVETAVLTDLPGMTAKELSLYRAVFLLDPSPLGPTVWKRLADYASSGRGVGIFLGNAADTSFNAPAAVELMGAKLLRQARDPDGETWITAGHGNSPVLSAFRQIQPLEKFPWDALPVFRYWEMTELSPTAEIAAAFSNGRPAIITNNIGQGRSLMMTTPLSETVEERTPWNLLPRGDASWMFVLLADGLARYLAGMDDNRYNFAAGETVTLRPDMQTLPATCQMSTPLGETVRLSPERTKREIVITDTIEPGNYRIRSGGAAESLDLGFSTNIPGEQMNLSKMDKSRLDGILGAGNYRLAKTPQEIEVSIARRRMGQELYAMIMLILAALFAGEYVLANRFYAATTKDAKTPP